MRLLLALRQPPAGQDRLRHVRWNMHTAKFSSLRLRQPPTGLALWRTRRSGEEASAGAAEVSASAVRSLVCSFVRLKLRQPR